MPRTVDLSSGTVALLKAHKKHQAEMKLADRMIYRDLGLVFTKEWQERGTLGLPLQTNNMGERGVPGHNQSGQGPQDHDARPSSYECDVAAQGWCVQAHVVRQRRLGRGGLGITLNVTLTRSQAWPQDAAAKLGALLYGVR